jgi:hypothetical protein
MMPVVICAQVGIGIPSPDGSAALEVYSTNKGVLIPRVANSGSVSNPATGLIIFNISSNQLEINSGTSSSPAWKKIVTEGSQVWQDSTTYIINNLARLNGEVQIFTTDGKMGLGTRHPKGAVDIQSTTGALIVPRMSSAEADLIPQQNGSIVYILSPGGSTFSSVGFWFYEDDTWVKK